MSSRLISGAILLAVLGLVSPGMAQPGKGKILVEYWLDIGSGTAIADLTGNANYPDNPSGSQWVSSWLFPPGSAGGSSWADNYGSRMRGYVYPPQTGDYTFWIAGDDLSELWLSTDDTPANIKLIARVTGWTDAMDWDQATGSTDKAAMKSAAIPLKAGQRYYMETRHKEGGGGDSVGVAWAGPGIGANHVLLDGKYCAAFIRSPEPMFMPQNPTPANGAVGVSMPLLQWTAGATAFFHDVYVGTDPNPPLVSARQPFALYYMMQGLTPGATYYWKVNEIEVDGVTMHEGPVWTFVAQDVVAYAPQPADAGSSVSPNITLTWQPGKGSVKQHLYLGTSADAVNEGAAGTDKGELDEATFTPDDLQGATTYYWRVDGIGADGTVQKGKVWTFTTFVLVDDFEGYTDDEGSRIYEGWIDGWTNNTGSQVGYEQAPFAEQTIVHGGTQSMPMMYDNSKTPFYSEAEKEFSPAQNWAAGGMTDLSLWVRGYAAMQSVAVSETGGKMSVTGAGTDIWGNSDQFTYAYKTLSGDGSLVARVTSIGPGTNTWAKGGVMIRDSLNGGSTHAMMVLTANSDGAAGNGASFQYRPTTDAVSSNMDSVAVITPPYWVKIDRMADSLSGYLSADGKTWNTMGTTIITMEDPIQIGICVTSHAAGENRTFEFDNISSSGGVSGQWQGAIINAPLHNSTQPFYVVVEDSAGKSAVVTDAAAVNSGTWTQVKVPLAGLTGVDLTKVKKVSLGVGDRANPAADGSGRIYIDDINVTK